MWVKVTLRNVEDGGPQVEWFPGTPEAMLLARMAARKWPESIASVEVVEHRDGEQRR